MNNSNLAAARNLIQVVTGEWKSRCVYVATRLGLADLIESGIDSDETLAAAVGSDAERIHRLMRLLVAFEIFQGDTRDGYANTPTSHLLRDVEGSFRDMVLFYGEEFHAA
ncbi:phenazine-1-carboxylate N-methyltransferase PhzM, partial [Pseudomonas aeruginosa]